MEVFGLTTEELGSLAEELGERRFRGKQLAEWLYKRDAHSFAEMTNLPAGFRQRLEIDATLTRCRIITKSESRDGTTKFLLELADGQRIESVLIPYPERVTVCVSTQVGCASNCRFCATAAAGFIRNLSAGEIADEVLTLQAQAGQRVTNVVYMGMGEPLLNYDSVLSSVKLLNQEVGIAMRRITISTVGIIPRIRKLQSEDMQLTLAISLHAPNDKLRRTLIPLASRYPIGELIAACRDYADSTHRRVTYEYLLIAGVNDSPELAKELVNLLKGSLCNVNLIPYNAVPGKDYKRPSAAAVNAFRAVLEQSGIEVTQRFERGHVVSAACGQLRASCENNKVHSTRIGSTG